MMNKTSPQKKESRGENNRGELEENPEIGDQMRTQMKVVKDMQGGASNE